MATSGSILYHGKLRDAPVAPTSHCSPVIRTVMNRSDWGTLLALALIWGAAFLFISVAVREVPPLTYVWARLSIAAVALWLLLLWRRQSVLLPRQAWGAILILALLNNVIPFILFGWGQTQIAAGLASILNATTPIWGVVVAHFFTRDERINARKLTGVLIGFAGVTVMIGPALLGNLGDHVLAQLACILAALCYALAGVWARRFKAMGLPSETVANGQLTAGAVLMLPLALLVDQPWLQPWPSLSAVGAILALALVCTAFAYILYFRLIGSAGATNALLVTLLVPPVAIVLGAVVLGEGISLHDCAGLALIALGLAAIDGRIFNLFRTTSRPRVA